MRKRKYDVRRKIALVLSAAMIFSFSQGVCAEELSFDPNDALTDTKENNDQLNEIGISENQPKIMEVQPEIIETQPQVATDQLEIGAENATNMGRIDISIAMALFLENDVTFTAVLTDDKGNSQESTVCLGSSTEDKFSFDDLADGEYTVTVTAPGFSQYSQKVTVVQKGYHISLTAGFCGGYTYEKEGLHPGVIMIGDVNGDGEVNDIDKNCLIDAVDGMPSEDGYVTDLNGDSETNLLDVSFLSKSYNETKDTEAAVEEYISPSAIEVKASDDTMVDGDPIKALYGDEAVVLTPANGKSISQDNPVSLEFDIQGNVEAYESDGIIIETENDNPISEAFINISYIENGKEYEVTVPVSSGISYLLKESEVYAEQDANGNILLHLGSQIAIKKVILTITGMQNNNNLAEISKVEFVNGMEKRIPEPEMDIPENLTANAKSEKFTLKWNPCVNVTGYEVLIQQGDKSETIRTVSNSLNVSSFKGKSVKNYTTYTVSVQSVNGAWRSGYCDAVEVTPEPSGPPDKPDNVSASGRYKSIVVNWKKMDDTLSYNLFYRLRDSKDKYTKISGIEDSKYTITELEDLTEYEIYVTGVNKLGESPESIHCMAKTTDLNPAEMPKYNVINRDENGVVGSAHIVAAERKGASMVDSELDADKTNTAWGTIDNNAESYYSKGTWDDGGFNNLGNNGLFYTFDKAYKMDTIALLPTDGMQYSYAKVRWWEEDGTNKSMSVSVYQKKDSEGRTYFMLKLPYAVNVKKIQIGLARYLATAQYRLITVSEVYFYNYDELRDEIMALYTDDLHTVLRPDVTQKTIDALRKKVESPDEYGEENPDKSLLLLELDTAEKILNDENINGRIEVINGISTNDANRGFSGLNAWQPLGVTAAAGDKITVYVGHNTKRAGENTNLQLVATKYHSEASGVAKVVGTLKVGANQITVPSLSTSIGSENGGALYVQYTGNNANDKYAVRVGGGTEVPILNLYKITDEKERLEKTAKFVKELEAYTAKLEKLHNERHGQSDNKNVNYSYDDKNCILGASDIMLDTMLLSLPAQQMLKGAGSGSTEDKARTILNSMDAMEDMMYLFYQHKGLNDSAPEALNKIPKGHLNIRYQRMFSGAFMYASGNHIGIEWGSTSGLVCSKSVVADDDGRYESGRYFGWGIAHEIGHCINQGSYAVAEITNNYFAQLAQAKDSNAGMRFKYNNIYSKVTSGTKGASSNIATQLGMYWQLHLAYDSGYNYKTYSDYSEQLENLFYARVDTYSRNPSAAPAPDGVKLTVGKNSDQNLMRLACAAAEKNILEFFERWGKEPDSETLSYAEQFEKETRAIFYVSDDSRVYSLNGSGSVLNKDGSTSAIDKASVNINAKAANKVEFTFSSKNIPEDDILGYEIVRCTISGGQIEQVPVGFTTGSTFTDTVTTLNNRTVFYKVTLIDKYLNRSAVVTTEMVKIEHDGSMDKTNWSISASGLTAEAAVHDATDEMPCEQQKDDPAKLALDNDVNTEYAPEVTADKAEIIIDFNSTLTTAGMKYTVGSGTPVGDYEVYVCENGEWILASEGTLSGGSKTIYFANDENKYVSTYAATAVKLVLLNQKSKTVSIAELDVLGVTGDNVDFRRTKETSKTLIGTLSADYKYGENSSDVIPKGSLIFTGVYKGNPAYNVVLLYDQDGNIVGGTDTENNTSANQIILADVPEKGNIANVSNGTWIYWIEPDQMKEMKMPERVRAELYRVNNAITNEGQRIVSDSLFEDIPDTLSNIVID